MFTNEEYRLIESVVASYELACDDRREYRRFLQAAEPLKHSENGNLRSLFVALREAVKLVHAAKEARTPRQTAKVREQIDHLKRKFARLMGCDALVN
ncbi:hypothetical protein [Paenibacillus contaminans]|uniref:Uncharacterized protein n=1 Tax=Paenibacillus contaminans TaxID=450362 RepID=A0A329MJH7_9BACL|nr:hypothetical protein [Paenibacillus contaminans]RAV19496.1 hypothetical protein DQG23_21145 [Paenibacillus contaminans]